MTVKSVTALEGARKAARLTAGLSGRPWPPDLLRAADAPRFLHSRRRGASADLRRKSRIDGGFAGKNGAVAGAKRHCRHNWRILESTRISTVQRCVIRSSNGGRSAARARPPAVEGEAPRDLRQ
jgi:hypothetical protein